MTREAADPVMRENTGLLTKPGTPKTKGRIQRRSWVSRRGTVAGEVSPTLRDGMRRRWDGRNDEGRQGRQGKEDKQGRQAGRQNVAGRVSGENNRQRNVQYMSDKHTL